MSKDRISNHRAGVISKGLVATRRAANPRPMEGFIFLEARAGGFYWVAEDGLRILRGNDLADAQDLQPTFVEAMLRAGRDGTSRRSKLEPALGALGVTRVRR